jgi:GT2 family glycosyltransferase
MDLTIIIASFNTKKLTLECLKSIEKHTRGINYEIIVIDNASDDGSLEVLKELEKNKRIKLIDNKKNYGFGYANNQGLELSAGKHVLFLNSDTRITSNLFPKMLSWMDENSDVGVISCALKNQDGTYQETGGYFPNLIRVFAWMSFIDDLPLLDKIIKPFHPMHSLSPLYKNYKHFIKQKDVDWLTGAFLFFRKKTLNMIGGYDTDYFMYMEDVDLCYRAKEKNWRVVYLPEWSIIHLGGGSSTKEYSLINEYKGIKIFYKKHKPKWQYPVLRVMLKSGALLRMVVFGVIKGPELFKIYAKAFKIA